MAWTEGDIAYGHKLQLYPYRDLSGFVDIWIIEIHSSNQNIDLQLTVSYTLGSVLNQNWWANFSLWQQPIGGTRKRAPKTMNRDEGAHFLSYIYDSLLMSSASTRTPPIGRRQREKFDHQFWWSTLLSLIFLSLLRVNQLQCQALLYKQAIFIQKIIFTILTII